MCKIHKKFSKPDLWIVIKSKVSISWLLLANVLNSQVISKGFTFESAFAAIALNEGTCVFLNGLFAHNFPKTFVYQSDCTFEFYESWLIKRPLWLFMKLMIRLWWLTNGITLPCLTTLFICWIMAYNFTAQVLLCWVMERLHFFPYKIKWLNVPANSKLYVQVLNFIYGVSHFQSLINSHIGKWPITLWNYWIAIRFQFHLLPLTLVLSIMGFNFVYVSPHSYGKLLISVDCKRVSCEDI